LPQFYMDFEAYQKGDPNYTSTTRDVRKLLSEAMSKGIDGLVMDLRNNGGGSLSEAIDLTGLFIKNGPVVQVRSYDNKVQVLKDDEDDIAYSGPMIVLTNRFSASASEIFAGAIQDYQRGVILGESTYGKGTVQTVLDLNRAISSPEDPGELKLTFQKFYRVTGSSTQNKGVTPDIELPSAFTAKQYGESSNPSALPWDVIKSASFQKTGYVNEKLLSALTKSFHDRLKTDAQLKKYVTETEQLKKNMAETKISLNEEERREERKKEKGQEVKENTKMGAKVPREGSKTDVLTLDDEYLRESLLMLSEMALKKIG
jgi:carboxyl-terminal processing protease